jgi:hypothetical protein
VIARGNHINLSSLYDTLLRNGMPSRGIGDNDTQSGIDRQSRRRGPNQLERMREGRPDSDGIHFGDLRRDAPHLGAVKNGNANTDS